MIVTVNSKECNFTGELITDLLLELGIESKGVAVAVNGRVVARTTLSEHKLHEGDEVMIITATYGG